MHEALFNSQVILPEPRTSPALRPSLPNQMFWLASQCQSLRYDTLQIFHRCLSFSRPYYRSLPKNNKEHIKASCDLKDSESILKWSNHLVAGQYHPRLAYRYETESSSDSWISKWKDTFRITLKAIHWNSSWLFGFASSFVVCNVASCQINHPNLWQWLKANSPRFEVPIHASDEYWLETTTCSLL